MNREKELRERRKYLDLKYGYPNHSHKYDRKKESKKLYEATNKQH
jgi:hypothetical protein